ncbi:MAG: hypothetical protein DYH12_24190 [Sorangiineae bacterium PRO1]|nr:hypothetical protein [Sorangiineae bacterium PRO1]
MPAIAPSTITLVKLGRASMLNKSSAGSTVRPARRARRAVVSQEISTIAWANPAAHGTHGRVKRALCLTVLALSGAPGCVRETRPEHAPAYAHPVTAYGWVAPAMPSGPHYASLAPPPPAAFTPASAPAPAASRPDVPTFQSSELPSGDACVAELTRLGVGFSRLDEKRGIATPVEVVGKINGIRYQSGTSTYMLADCRLVLALHRVAPVLSDLGVTTVRFSGAYSYRMSRVGRLSLHAHGLALDVHEVQFGTSWQSVERDFARGLPDGCAAQSPLLNQLGCRLRATHLFKELLTPDYDADHHNHFHLELQLARPLFVLAVNIDAQLPERNHVEPEHALRQEHRIAKAPRCFSAVDRPDVHEGGLHAL